MPDLLNMNYSETDTLKSEFEKQVQYTPDLPAITFKTITYTYKELNTLANQFAHYLINTGITTNDIIAFESIKSIWTYSIILGTIKSGAAYLPIDPSIPDERKNLMLTDSNARVYVHENATSNKSAEFPTLIPYPELEKLLSGLPGHNPDIVLTRNDIAYINYTSGTTGKPNGVEITHRGVLRLVKTNGYFPFSESHVFLQIANLSFDASTFEIWGAWLNGHKLVIQAQKEIDLVNLGALIRLNEITTAFFTTSFFNLIVTDRCDILKGMKHVIVGGEALSSKHISQAIENHPTICFYNGYGPTECTTFSVSYRFSADPKRYLYEIPIGKPIHETSVYLFDEQMHLLTKVDHAGELYIGGNGLAKGYLNNPELTSQKFIQHPDNKERIYKTGDLCKWNQHGELVFVSRVDQQVKIRGFRVEIEEIERKINMHSDIKQCVVIPFKTEFSIELIAVIVRKNEVLESDLIHYLEKSLPHYMIPSDFIEVNEFTLTKNGKVDRKAIEQFLNEQKTGIVHPTIQSEDVVLKMYNELLNRSDFKDEDSFFAIGGHSLLAIRLLNRIQERCGVQISISDFLTNPTLSFIRSELSRLSDREAVAVKSSASITSSVFSDPEIKHNKPQHGLLPLSPSQESIWLFNEVSTAKSVNNIAFKIELTGKLNYEVFSFSINELLAIHESFRLNFIKTEGLPYKKVQPSVELEIPVIDLSINPTENPDLNHLIQNECKSTFDLEKDLLVKFMLYKIDTNHHVVLFVVHHIIFDGLSMNIFLSDLSEIYNSKLKGNYTRKKSIPGSISDKMTVNTTTNEEHLRKKNHAFWLNLLGLNPETSEFTPDFPRPSEKNYEGDVYIYQLPTNETELIQSFIRSQKISLYIFLQSCFQLLVYIHTRSENVITGTLYHNRTTTEQFSTIGYFINNIVLSTNFTHNITFSEITSQVKDIFYAGINKAEIPYKDLVELIVTKRDISRNPLFQLLFVLQKTAPELLNLSELGSTISELNPGYSKYDLSFYLEEKRKGIEIRVEYSTDLFREERIQSLVSDYRRLVQLAMANPEENTVFFIDALSGFSSEKYKLQSVPLIHKGKTVNQIIAEAVKANPAKTALIVGNEQLSYEQLDFQSNRVAHYLIRNGYAGSDKIVGVMMERTRNLIISLLGILKAGCAYLPIDKLMPAERMRYMISDCAPVLVLVDDAIADARYDLISSVANHAAVSDIVSAELPETPVTVNQSETDLMYTIYTSGSTGKPKAVLIEHRSVVNLIEGLYKQCELQDQQRFLCATTFSFDIFVVESWLPLCYGKTIVLANEPQSVDPVKMLTLIESTKTDFVQATPTRIHWLFSIASDKNNVGCVTKFMVGGEPFTENTYRNIRKYSDAEIYNVYGPTETTVWSTFKKIESSRNIDIGSPIQNNRIYIVDKNHRLCKAGTTGEIAIGGISLARAYHNNPDLTETKFVPDLLFPDEKMYLTGDYGVESEESVFACKGRIDSQVKIHGYRIELNEVEIALNSLDGIKESVVIAREIGPQLELIAFVVPDSNSTIEKSQAHNLRKQLRKQLKEKLPVYMVPSVFEVLTALPVTVNGKVDKSALILSEEQTREQNDLHRNPTEKKIASIWSKYLTGISPGLTDNFFEIGGNSLTAVRMITEINQQFGLNLSPGVLFQHPTIEKLSHLIDTNEYPSHLIVRLKDGIGNPLYLAPGLGGNALTFKEFSTAYTLSNPLFAFEYPDVLVTLVKERNLKSIARIYVDEIVLHTCSTQAVYLAGYSLGGRLVFEIALQLQAMGRKVGLLAVIDTFSPLINLDYLQKGVLQKIKAEIEIIPSEYFGFRLALFSMLPIRIFTAIAAKQQSKRNYQRQTELYRLLVDSLIQYHTKEVVNTDFLGITQDESRYSPLFISYYIRKVRTDFFWKDSVDGNSYKTVTLNCDHTDFFSKENVGKIVQSIEQYLAKEQKTE